jgi:hypothetical protein
VAEWCPVMQDLPAGAVFHDRTRHVTAATVFGGTVVVPDEDMCLFIDRDRVGARRCDNAEAGRWGEVGNIEARRENGYRRIAPCFQELDGGPVTLAAFAERPTSRARGVRKGSELFNK